jgi:large subunit ribosomal protein L25
VGEAPAVENKEGELQHTMNTLKVSCLPAEIPEHIEVDVSGLEEIDEAIRVSQLKVPADVEILADPEEVVAKIVHIREVEEEEVEEVEGEEGEAVEGEEAEGAEGAEGEAAPAEGEGEGAQAPAESGSEES